MTDSWLSCLYTLEPSHMQSRFYRLIIYSENLWICTCCLQSLWSFQKVYSEAYQTPALKFTNGLLWNVLVCSEVSWKCTLEYSKYLLWSFPNISNRYILKFPKGLLWSFPKVYSEVSQKVYADIYQMPALKFPKDLLLRLIVPLVSFGTPWPNK